MRNIVLIVFTVFSVNTVLSQTVSKDRLTFEIGIDQNQFEMSSLNRFYVDSFALQANPKLLDKGITSGHSFRGSLIYRPVELFDIGIYGLYQFGVTDYNPQFIETDEFGMVVARPVGQFSIRTEAVSFGLTSNFFISHLLGFGEKNKKFLSGSHISIELQGGWGYSRVVADLQRPDQPMFSSYAFFTSQDFQGAIGIKYSYDITRNNLISSIGFRCGYQFFKTGTVEDRLGDEWVIQGENPITLDFSGLYYGITVGIGK